MNTVAFFCEGVRDEAYGTKTIYGLFDSSLNIPGPGVLPRLTCCVSIQFDLNEDLPNEIFIKFDSFGEINETVYHREQGTTVDEFTFNREILYQEIIPFVILEEGQIVVSVKTDVKKEYKMVGVLPIRFEKGILFPGFRLLPKGVLEKKSKSPITKKKK
jgi:hypothetical protein